MTYHIIWKNADGSLKITSMHAAATLEEATEHKDKLILNGETALFQVIATSNQLPQDRYFRNAWRFEGGNLTLDIGGCRQRHLDKLRRIRNAKLQDSDPDYMRALEQGDTVKLDALKTYRQALRDMPQNTTADLQAASAPDAIRNVRPTILTAPKP